MSKVDCSLKQQWYTAKHLLEGLKKKFLSDYTKCWQVQRASIFIHCCWEYKMLHPFCCRSLAVSYKAKHCLYVPAIVLLGIYSYKLKPDVHTKICKQIFIVIIHNHSKLEAIKLLFSRWMDKQCGTSIQLNAI